MISLIVDEFERESDLEVPSFHRTNEICQKGKKKKIKIMSIPSYKIFQSCFVGCKHPPEHAFPIIVDYILSPNAVTRGSRDFGVEEKRVRKESLTLSAPSKKLNSNWPVL